MAEGIAPQSRARAMSWTGAAWGVALVVGPALGGLLARPAVQVRETPSWPRSWASFSVF